MIKNGRRKDGQKIVKNCQTSYEIVKKGQKLSKMVNMEKMVGLAFSGPDVPAWAAKGRERRSQEAWRASSKKLGPGGAPKLLVDK